MMGSRDESSTNAHFLGMVLRLQARNAAPCRVAGLVTEEVLSWPAADAGAL
ncbi:hypothetical protein LJ655_15385 [Paraburkholderia sp. MMS20-SJTN17]|uniref:Uncharacterized protein n=1 Tax=Paraburkholderia translucens TaxID=2886945 RepID=A0ABS8KEX9_9BURK|nr:hypothetical protein [Paraburkholderia sp. MMS20-SJTN17]MCC8403255.1 hypothetical protein [Paraburkholderia sp. MMS20-SJTN17]